MKYCQYCGADNQDQSCVCVKCGKTFPEETPQMTVPTASALPKDPLKRCPSCGEPCEEGLHYCVCCGSMLPSVAGEVIRPTVQLEDSSQPDNDPYTEPPQILGSTAEKGESTKKSFWQKMKKWWKGMSGKKLLILSGSTLAALGFIALFIVLSVRYAYMNGSCGRNLEFSCDGDGVLTISGSGKMDDFGNGTCAPWNEIWWLEITEVIIEDGVTSIGENAFDNCGFTDIDIPDSVTEIGASAFDGCDNLESIDIPDSVTEIGFYAFGGCDKLERVELPSGITKIEQQTFGYCSSLEEIVLPEGITEIGERAFEYCGSLTSIKIPKGVVSVGWSAFRGCRQLREVKLPKTLREIKRDAFRETGLEELEIPSGVGVIGDSAFRDCTSLKSITFLGMAPNWESDKEDRACYCFVGVTATVYYPRWNETWYDYNVRDLGGDLTFVPYSRS